MIKANARLSIQRIPLECLQIKEYQERYLAQVEHYVTLIKAHPDEYPGLIHVVASDTHPGMYCILDGHHRFLASVIAGRIDGLCLAEEETDA